VFSAFGCSLTCTLLQIDAAVSHYQKAVGVIQGRMQFLATKTLPAGLLHLAVVLLPTDL
jgi:hypothetical protein